MHILVAGGAGYIGSVVTTELLQAGHHVVVFDNLSSGYCAAVHPEAIFIHGDLADADALEQAFSRHPGIEAVVHCAAKASVDESRRHPEQYLGDNVTNGTNLIAAAVRFNVGRFILLSTADIFGADVPVPIVEQAPVFPSSPYGESLYLLERILGWYDRVAGLRFASLRCFNVAGAGECCGEYRVPQTHLIPALLDVAQGKRSHLTLFGDDYPTPDGSCVRDYIHVVDVAHAIIRVVQALDTDSRIYNLGSGTGHSTKEVIALARSVTGHPIPYVVERRRPFEPAVHIAATTQIRRELGWTPQFSDLERIIRSAWAWQRQHPKGYKGD